MTVTDTTPTDVELEPGEDEIHYVCCLRGGEGQPRPTKTLCGLAVKDDDHRVSSGITCTMCVHLEPTPACPERPVCVFR